MQGQAGNSKGWKLTGILSCMDRLRTLKHGNLLEFLTLPDLFWTDRLKTIILELLLWTDRLRMFKGGHNLHFYFGLVYKYLSIYVIFLHLHTMDRQEQNDIHLLYLVNDNCYIFFDFFPIYFLHIYLSQCANYAIVVSV